MVSTLKNLLLLLVPSISSLRTPLKSSSFVSSWSTKTNDIKQDVRISQSITRMFDGGIANTIAIPENMSSSYKNKPIVTPGSRKSTYRTKYDSAKVGNLVVPTVGIGTISWSSKSLTELENLELQILVKEAYRCEVPFFDTAERYGSNWKTALGLGWGETESLINKYVTKAMQTDDYMVGRKKQLPVVATKFTPSPWRTTVESVVEACENSRKRLGVEQIDLYQMNMPDIVQPFGIGSSKDEVYWQGLAECYHRGLVKNVGVSNYGPTLLMKCQDSLSKLGVPLASNQIAYSLIGRQNGAQETVDKCLELGIKPLACYPFAMGLLTGKYSEKRLKYSATDATLAPLTNSKKSRLEIRDLLKYSSGSGNGLPVGGIDPLLRELEMIAMDREKTIAQVALNYIICKGAIPIPGARSIAQVRDNIGAMGWRLTPCEVEQLEDAADKLGFSFEGAGFKRVSEKFVGYGTEKWSLD